MEGIICSQQLKLLTAQEKYNYCDPELFELIKVLSLAQIDSYTLFWEELHRESQRIEYLQSNLGF